MEKLWSTKDLLEQDEREILVWHHSLNHFSLKYFLGISKRWAIPSKLRKVRKLASCVACFFGKYHNRTLRTKVKHSCGFIRKPSDTRPGAMNFIDQMIYAKPGIINQATGDLTHVRLRESIVFV